MQLISSDLIQRAIEVIALVIISLLGYGAKQLFSVTEAWLDEKIGKSKVDSFKSYARTTVRALEQSPAYRDWDGANKKEMGLVLLSNYAQAHGIPVDQQFCDHVLEEAVQIMKQQQSPLLDLADFVLDVDPTNNEA